MKNIETLKMQALLMGLHTPMQSALYYPGCDENITDPSNTDCPVKELGDIRGFAFIHTDFTFTDPSQTSEWTTGINARDIYVFNLGRGSLEMTETTSPGFGANDETLDGYDFVANISEPSYKANWGFWNTIKNTRTYKFAYVTETLVHLSSETCVIIPKAPISEGDKKAAIVWNAMVSWAQDSLPQPYDKPSGVFDKAIAL